MLIHRNARFGPIHAPAFGGAERLADTPLILGGKKPDVDFRYVGADASPTSFPGRVVGGTLSLSGSGNNPTLDTGPNLRERVVITEGDQKYFDSATAFANALTGKDVINEFVVWTPPTANAAQIIKNNTVDGWMLYFNGTSIALLWYQSSAATVWNYATVDEGVFLHLLYSFEWGASTYGYLQYHNGVYRNLFDDTTGVTSLPNKSINTQTTSSRLSRILFAAQYSLAGLLPGGVSNKTLMDALAKERAALWMGQSLAHNHGELTPSAL